MARLTALVARRRTLLGLAVIAAIAATVFAALPRADQDSPEAAIYALAHAVEHKDTETICERLIDVADASLKLNEQPGCPARRNDVAFDDPLVYSVKDLPDFGGANRGVQAACAKVSFDGGRPTSVLLAKPGTRWRVLRVRGSLTAARTC